MVQHLPEETFGIFHSAGNYSENLEVQSLIQRAGRLVVFLMLALLILYLLMFLEDGILLQ